jgi:hypothetical protein
MPPKDASSPGGASASAPLDCAEPLEMLEPEAAAPEEPVPAPLLLPRGDPDSLPDPLPPGGAPEDELPQPIAVTHRAERSQRRAGCRAPREEE